MTLRGRAWLRARRLDLARADLEAALEGGAEGLWYPAARLDLATCLLDLGEFEASLRLFHACHEAQPGEPLALFGVGRSAAFLGRWEEAERAFAEVLELRPGHVETLLGLAQACENLGNLGGALRCLQEAEKGDPQRAETQLQLAKILRALGQDQLAAEHQARYERGWAAGPKKEPEVGDSRNRPTESRVPEPNKP